MNELVKTMLEDALELLLNASTYPNSIWPNNGLDSDQIEELEKAIEALRNVLELEETK